MSNWFWYDSNGTKSRLITQQELENLVAQQVITRHTRLETESGQLGLAGQVPGLFSVKKSSPFTAISVSLMLMVFFGIVAFPVCQLLWRLCSWAMSDREHNKLFFSGFVRDNIATVSDGISFINVIASIGFVVTLAIALKLIDRNR